MEVLGSFFQNKSNRYWIQNNNYSNNYINNNTQKETDYSDPRTLATVGGLQLFTVLLQKISQWCSNKLMAGKEFASADDVKKVADYMVGKNNLNVTVDYLDRSNVGKYPTEMQELMKTVARGENAFYLDEKNLAVAPATRPSLILHELGHATNAIKGKFMKFLQRSRAYVSAVPAVLVYINKIFKNNDNQPTFVEKYAGVIGFAAFLPTIIEEGIASFRGVNAAKKVLGKNANLKLLKRNYFTAWLTYLLSGFGLGVAAKQCILQNKTE